MIQLSPKQPSKRLDGKMLAAQIEQELTQQIAHEHLQLRMDVILIGDHAASLAYVQQKKAMCERVGIACHVHTFNADIPQKELLQHMEQLNTNPDVTGYIVQLPLPPHIDLPTVIAHIAPHKDVDGFSFHHTGHLFHEYAQDSYLVPATAAGFAALCSHYHISLESARMLVIGKGFVVGKPIALLGMQANATVTVAHALTRNLKNLTKQADIIVSATGVKHLITPDMVTRGVILFDVGFTREGNRVYGDISPACYKKASWYTPVPGGIGPMTVACLLRNVYNAHKQFSLA